METFKPIGTGQAEKDSGKPSDDKPGFTGFADFFRLARKPVKSCDKQPGEVSGKSDPEIEVVQENGVVKRIVVTCVCGEKIEIDCQYDTD